MVTTEWLMSAYYLQSFLVNTLYLPSSSGKAFSVSGRSAIVAVTRILQKQKGEDHDGAALTS